VTTKLPLGYGTEEATPHATERSRQADGEIAEKLGYRPTRTIDDAVRDLAKYLNNPVIGSPLAGRIGLIYAKALLGQPGSSPAKTVSPAPSVLVIQMSPYFTDNSQITLSPFIAMRVCHPAGPTASSRRFITALASM
jgi:hypothetical protein